MVATSMPIVVLDRAIHLYFGWFLSQRALGAVIEAKLTAGISGLRGWADRASRAAR